MNYKKLFISTLAIIVMTSVYKAIQTEDISKLYKTKKHINKNPNNNQDGNPHWASVKATKTHLKSGPDFNSKTKAILQKPNIPVYVVMCNKKWCNVRLVNGITGWINRINLSNKKTSMVISEAAIYSKPISNSTAKKNIVGKIYPYVTLEVIETVYTQDGEKWCLINKQGLKGYISCSVLAGGHTELDN